MAIYPPELEAFIQQKLASGAFASREELEVAAVAYFRSQESRIDNLRAEIATAREQVARGEIHPMDIDAIKKQLCAEVDENGNPY